MVRRIASVLILASAPLSAFAGDPLAYSFIEGQYLNTQFSTEVNGVKSDDDEFEGWRAAAQVSLYKFVYFTGEADKRRPLGYRFSTQSVGLGAHTTDSMSKLLQLYGNATYERMVTNNLDNVTPDDSDEGFGLEGGVRVPYDSFELSASYRYSSYGKTQDIKVTGDRYGAGVLVQLTPYFGLTGDYRHVGFDYKPSTGSFSAKSEFNEWLVGFRAYFATDIDRYRRRGGLFGSGE